MSWPPGLRGPVAGLVAMTAMACGSEPPVRPPVRSARLEGGVVASVAGSPVGANWLSSVARATEANPREALKAIVRGRLWALEAARRGEGWGTILAARRSALSRALLERLWREAREQGAPSNAEVVQAVEQRWEELANPGAVRVLHAVALFGEGVDEAEVRVLADRVARAVEGNTEPKAFAAAARGVDAGEVKLRVELLDPVTPDGRVMRSDAELRAAAPTRRYEASFGDAVNKLTEGAPISPVFRTRFGFHVALLVEQVSPTTLSPSEQRQRVARDVYSTRARALRLRLLERLRSEIGVEQSRDALNLTARAQVEP